VYSAEELRFRLRQEIWNAKAFLFPPKRKSGIRIPAEPFRTFASPAQARSRVAGTPLSSGLDSLSDSILRHEFPVFGSIIQTGNEIEWRRDYINRKNTGAEYIRRIPYLDFDKAGDHKVIWELNRHQHLVVLAQAACLTGRQDCIDEIAAQLKSWFAANPPLRGMNWVSALEVAFRAFSWIWVWHLAAGALGENVRNQLLDSLYQHGCYLEHNLSVYFSPNTHLLGEAVVLHALGALFPALPGADGWRRYAGQIVEEQMQAQVRDDGVHFEQSTYYHVYALDFFLFHALLSNAPRAYLDKLSSMAEFLHAVMGPARRLPFFGDDDGGRLFFPYGDRSLFGRATLATAGLYLNRPEWVSSDDVAVQAAWWLPNIADVATRYVPPCESRLFNGSGFAVFSSGDIHGVVKAGPFGPWSGGHSHSDVLSMTLTAGDEEIVIDPATYTYVADRSLRDWFRGAAAHNVIRIDGRDQAVPAGPFGWSGKPDSAVLAWRTSKESDVLEAECRFDGFRCRRMIYFRKPGWMLISDEVSGSDAGEHRIEQLWHLAEERHVVRFVFAPGVETDVIQGWRSRVLGSREEAPVLAASVTSRLPVRIVTAIDLTGAAEAGSVTVEQTDEGMNVRIVRAAEEVSISLR
jgi:hypothetical protein